MRKASIARKTKETDIKLSLDLDGGGACTTAGTGAASAIDTGIGFFDHMLTAFAVHSGVSLDLTCKGDLEVDCHHSVEDIGITLGQAIAEALGERKGIARYGFFTLPMDESLASCAVDVSGRPYLIFTAEWSTERIGEMETQLFVEFFRALAFNAGLTLHINLKYGFNDHHKAEAIFKAFAHAFKIAITPTGSDEALSSKGTLSA